jgi:hypothetical protein
MLDWTSAPFVRSEKKWNEILKLAILAAIWGYEGACDLVWQTLRLEGVWSQVVGFVLMRLAGIWLQSPLKLLHI